MIADETGMWPEDECLKETDLELVELARVEAADQGGVEFETFFDLLLGTHD